MCSLCPTVLDTQTRWVMILCKHRFHILSDIDYPGWKAKVDGKETKILRADYLIRAVELFPGKHKVIMRYEPFSFKIGAIISLATLGMLLLSIIIFFFYKTTNKFFT